MWTNARLGMVDNHILLIEKMGRNQFSDWEYNLRSKAGVSKAFDLSTDHQVVCLVTRLLDEPKLVAEVSGPHFVLSDEARKVVTSLPFVCPNFSSVRLPNFLPVTVHDDLAKSYVVKFEELTQKYSAILSIFAAKYAPLAASIESSKAYIDAVIQMAP